MRIVQATRQPSPTIAFGASPRATLGLVAAGRALALLRGREFVLPEDVLDVAPEILRHRILLTYDAMAEDVEVDDLLARLLPGVPAPRVAPRQDDALMAAASS